MWAVVCVRGGFSHHTHSFNFRFQLSHSFNFRTSSSYRGACRALHVGRLRLHLAAHPAPAAHLSFAPAVFWAASSTPCSTSCWAACRRCTSSATACRCSTSSAPFFFTQVGRLRCPPSSCACPTASWNPPCGPSSYTSLWGLTPPCGEKRSMHAVLRLGRMPRRRRFTPAAPPASLQVPLLLRHALPVKRVVHAALPAGGRRVPRGHHRHRRGLLHAVSLSGPAAPRHFARRPCRTCSHRPESLTSPFLLITG